MSRAQKVLCQNGECGEELEWQVWRKYDARMASTMFDCPDRNTHNNMNLIKADVLHTPDTSCTADLILTSLTLQHIRCALTKIGILR